MNFPYRGPQHFHEGTRAPAGCIEKTVESLPARRDWLIVASEQRRPQLSDILMAVAKVTKVPLSEILSPRRWLATVEARDLYYALAREMTLKSLPQIGRACGGRDHSTVENGLRKAGKLDAATLGAVRREIAAMLADRAAERDDT